MSSELYDRIVSERGSFERLVAKIPGFRGYHEKNARRKADSMLRRYLAEEFEKALQRFIRIENRILDGGKGLRHMTRTREVKRKLQAYIDRVKTAAPKYSGMWASVKVDNDVLDRVYAFDEAQVRYREQFDKALDKLESAVAQGEDFTDALESVYNVAAEANDAYRLRDDEILRLGDSV